MNAAQHISRLVVTTGGTGGHIFPALAVAAEIRRRAPEARVLFLGGNGPEGELARKAGLDFEALPASGVLGKGVQALLATVWVGKGVILATRALRHFKPEVVIGFGGYAGFCPVLAAALLGIPTAVHEQNSVPGVTNRTLGRLVNFENNTFAALNTAFLQDGIVIHLAKTRHLDQVVDTGVI